MAKKDFAPETVNKKASFDYFFEQKFEAGIVLTGTEVKSLRTGQVNLTDAYCVFKNGELWVKNIHIAEYKQGGYANHIAKSDRKLLMHKRELEKLQTKLKTKGTPSLTVTVNPLPQPVLTTDFTNNCVIYKEHEGQVIPTVVKDERSINSTS